MKEDKQLTPKEIEESLYLDYCPKCEDKTIHYWSSNVGYHKWTCSKCGAVNDCDVSD